MKCWGMEFPKTYKVFTLEKGIKERVVHYKKTYEDKSFVDVLLVVNTRNKYTLTCRKFDSDGSMVHQFPHYLFTEYEDIKIAYEALFHKMNNLAIRLLVN